MVYGVDLYCLLKYLFFISIFSFPVSPAQILNFLARGIFPAHAPCIICTFYQQWRVKNTVSCGLSFYLLSQFFS